MSVLPEKSLRDCPEIDFVCRKEFDYAVVDYAKGKPLEEIPGVSFLKDGKIVHNPGRAANSGSGRAAARDRGLQARSGRYQVQRSVPAASVCIALHDARMPGAVHVLPVAADVERTSVAQAFDRRCGARNGEGQSRCGRNVKEFFFDDDTFNIQKARTDRAVREAEAAWD